MAKIFAYGSLVNKETRLFNAEIEAVKVKGWVRQWRAIIQTDTRKICALTIVPDSTSSIDGIIMIVDAQAEYALHEREIGYEKVEISKSSIIQNTIPSEDQEAIFSFSSIESKTAWASEGSPILLSYIDVVASGYYDLFGMEGLISFFQSTQGWNLPILNDREQPIYPRATKQDPDFLDIVDQQIAANC